MRKRSWITVLLFLSLLMGLFSCKSEPRHSPYSYIQGIWLEPNPINPSGSQGIALKEDGTASSVGMATLIFKKWVLNGDKLLLTYESIGNKQTLEGTDTLQIEKLNADSLVLSASGNVVWRLAREKSE